MEQKVWIFTWLETYCTMCTNSAYGFNIKQKMPEIVQCHQWGKKSHTKGRKDYNYTIFIKHVNLRPPFTFTVAFTPFFKLSSHWRTQISSFGVVKFCFAYCLQTVSNMAKEICWVYSNGFHITAVQCAAFRKARADNSVLIVRLCSTPWKTCRKG